MRLNIIRYWIIFFLIIFNLFIVCFSNNDISGQLEDQNKANINNSNYGSIGPQLPSGSKTYFVSGSPIGNEPVTFNNMSNTASLAGFRSDSFAWGDYNNDGFLDFLARGNLSMGTRLYRNNGPPVWNFTDVTDAYNLSGNSTFPNRGYPIWGDYNNDGYLDYFIAGDLDQLWKNNGPPNWNFTNVTLAAGNLNDQRPSEAAAWGDYDRDGYLDLYVNSWRDAQNNKYADVLWHNNGDGTFSDVSTQAGIYGSTTPNYESPPFAGMGVAWGDYNNDGWPDIYVCNYLVAPNYLWRNNHDGTFTDVAVEQGVAGKPDIYNSQGPYYGHTAGAGWADFNNNGNLDLWISNLAHKDSELSGGLGRGYFCDDSMMLRNSGSPSFELLDIRNRTGIPITPVGAVQGSQWKDEDYFGVTWGDYDNDGDIDMWIPQVKTYHSWARSYLWQNNNDETFTDASDSVGIKVWSNTGAVWGDYNNDGFLDLLTEGTYQYQGKRETRLFKNSKNSNNWLQLQLKGITSNSAAIGARLYLTTGETTQMREIGGDAGGHAFQNSFRVEFGLGQNTMADEVKIIWPSGIVQVLKNINANQILNVTENITGPEIKSTTVSKYVALEDEMLSFTVSYTDPISLMQWDYDNDGIIDYECTGCYPPSYFNFTKKGNYTAKTWVWDGNQELGWTETTDIIVINNVAPIADPGPNLEAWEDQSIVFNGSQSIDTPSDKNDLEFNWTFEDNVFSGWQSKSDAEYNFSDKGEYEVTLFVRDDDHTIDYETLTVTINNKPPSCIIISNSTAQEDSAIYLRAIGTDTISDLPTLRYQWDYGDGEISEWMFETITTYKYTNNGKYTIKCSVRDDEGYSDENYSEVEILVYNVDPLCFVDEDKTALEDQSIEFDGYGTDTKSDQASLKYLWDFDDGTTSDWLPEFYQDVTHVFTKQGFYEVKLIVSDDDNATAQKIVNVTIENVAPECNVDEAKLTKLEDEIISFTGSATDTQSDIDLIRYSWDFGVSGVPMTPWNSTSEFEFRYRISGEYDAVLTAMDDDGETATASMTIIINNIEPTAKFTVDKDEIVEDEIIIFNAASSTDSGSDIENLLYIWDFKDTSPKQNGQLISHRFYETGEYKVELTVTDDDGSSDLYFKKIEVNNIEPTAVISVSTLDATPDTIITFNGLNSTDTPSDRRNLTYTWTFGPNEEKVGVVVSHSYDEPNRYKVKLKVTDDDSAEAEAEIYITIAEETKASDGSSSHSETDQNTIYLAVSGVIALFIVLLLFLFIFLKTEQREDHKEKNPEINEITESNDKPQPEPESGPTHSENTQEVSADIDINKTEMIPNNDTPTLSEPQDTTSVIYAHEKEPKLPETLILPKLKAKND